MKVAARMSCLLPCSYHVLPRLPSVLLAREALPCFCHATATLSPNRLPPRILKCMGVMLNMMSLDITSSW